jgi:hypothetical protein
MQLVLELSETHAKRMEAVAIKRNVSIEALAVAYIDDWLSIEYAEMLGRMSRRGTYRDGPIAFDSQAAEAAARVERDVKEIEKRAAGF